MRKIISMCKICMSLCAAHIGFPGNVDANHCICLKYKT